MNCTVCKEPISEARLIAIRKLGLRDTRCIECARQNDVPKIKRFDERRGEQEISTYFTHNPYIEQAIKDLMEGSFAATLGNDDSFCIMQEPVGDGSLAEE